MASAIHLQRRDIEITRRLEQRMERLEGDLSVAQLQLARIADEVIDPGLDEAGLRQAVMNIRYIINPAM